MMIKKKWIANEENPGLIEKLSLETGYDDSLVRILINRKNHTAEDIEGFLNPSLKNLFDPFLLNDMKLAVERIKLAISDKEKIYIYGDYDVDGVTASSLLYTALKELDALVDIYIPDREAEGYGLNLAAVQKIHELGGTLIITVDCGITSVSEAELSKKLGIDMIVTDHHTCPEILPDCVAVINPKRKDSTYPFSELCGAGVALKLCSALGVINDTLLSIAAIGTVADIVPLVSENRIIAAYGIEKLKEGILENINILTSVAGSDYKTINARTLGFTIAPRINAAGRMASAKEAVEFFITKDKKRMIELSEYLNSLNEERQATERQITEEAKALIEKTNEDKNPVIVLWNEGWHEGVIGIVASRLTELYYKPCVLISVNNGIAKGSSRSIKGFNIYDALKGVSSYLIKFGGHSLAAGLSLYEKDLLEFKEKLNENSREIFENNSFFPEITLDCELKAKNINVEYFEFLKALEPFGMGNPEPVFLIKNAQVKSSFSFSMDKHMRLNLSKDGKDLETVGFGLGSYAPSLRSGDKLHLAATLGINEYKGIKRLQGVIRDIKLVK
ncbi:MAG: single-stranded-DNA-specific exonuclease RecJ [Ruminococcaceae bacterium]|nr:single-stranded-DNA-specific exonuclease RecJ [Oscillospiraceae bacterium]